MENEKALLMSALQATPRHHVNMKSHRTLPVANFTCYGNHDEDCYDVQLLRSYVNEMIELKRLLVYAVGDSISSLIMWRGQVKVGSKHLPLHSLLAFFGEHKLPLVLDGATHSGAIASQIAASGVPVIVEMNMNPEGGGRDFGKSKDAEWPDHTVASTLAAAGCRIAITQPDRVSPMHLKFAAGLALRLECAPHGAETKTRCVPPVARCT